jgi:hypothetical protein
MPETLNIQFDDREFAEIRRISIERETGDHQTVRHLVRLGQMAHLMMSRGYKMLFEKDDELTDPFDTGPKMAPKPSCSACERSQRREWTEPEEHTCGLEQWSNEGGA